MNNQIQHKSWFKRNWKWFLPSIVILALVFSLLFSTKLGDTIVGMAKAYSEASVCDNALETAKKNEQVIQLLGELQPLDKLAILEGALNYSNNYNTLDITVRVTGSEKKIKSRMDISADRNGDEWVYKTINIRIKSPENLKQTIEIIKQPE